MLIIDIQVFIYSFSEYTYTNNGKPLTYVRYGKSNELESTTDYIYNSSGILEEVRIVEYYGDEPSETHGDAVYDENGNLSEIIYYNNNGDMTSACVYDSNENMVEQRFYYKGRLSREYYCTYEKIEVSTNWLHALLG